MSERMIEIKRSIEKQRRRRKHIKEITVFGGELLAVMSIFGSLYLVLVFVGAVV